MISIRITTRVNKLLKAVARVFSLLCWLINKNNVPRSDEINNDAWQSNLNTCHSFWQVTDDWSLFILLCNQLRIVHGELLICLRRDQSSKDKQRTDRCARKRRTKIPTKRYMDKWVQFQFDFTFASEKYRIFLIIRNSQTFYHFQVFICNFISFKSKLFVVVLEYTRWYFRVSAGMIDHFPHPHPQTIFIAEKEANTSNHLIASLRNSNQSLIVAGFS